MYKGSITYANAIVKFHTRTEIIEEGTETLFYFLIIYNDEFAFLSSCYYISEIFFSNFKKKYPTRLDL